jgi:hypothetical protein
MDRRSINESELCVCVCVCVLLVGRMRMRVWRPTTLLATFHGLTLSIWNPQSKIADLACLLGLLFDPEGGGNTFVWNAVELLPDYSASHPVRHYCASSLPCSRNWHRGGRSIIFSVLLSVHNACLEKLKPRDKIYKIEKKCQCTRSYIEVALSRN